MISEKLSSSLEDYLETIYNFIDKNQHVRAIDISRQLGVSRASVSEALKKLADKKLINYGRYDVISMTQDGISQARKVIEKHNALQYFFQEIMGLDPSEAADTACKIEHVISEKVLEKFTSLKSFHLTHPEYTQKIREYHREN